MTNISQSMYGYIKDRLMCIKDKSTLMRFYGHKIDKNMFFKEIDKVSSYLQSIDVKKGDNVIICLGNIPNAIIAFYAVNKIGAIANVVHPLIKEKELINIKDKMNPKAYIVFDEFYIKYNFLHNLEEKVILCGARDYLSNILSFLYPVISYKNIKNIKLTNNCIQYKNIKSTSLKEVEVEGQDIAVYMHSSGTTGEPKTACLTNFAFNALAKNMLSRVFDTDIDNSIGMLMALPIFHTFGLGVCMHTALAHGAQIILMPKFNATYLSLMMYTRPINVLAGVPNMYRKLSLNKIFNGNKLKKLKLCVCGGDKLPKDVRVKFEEKLTKAKNDIIIVEGYGLTEAGICSINDKAVYKEDSLGTPFNNTEFIIFDENKQDLGKNKVGQIYVTSQSLMEGYYLDEAATNEIVYVDSNNKKWLNTGDIGYLDEDNHLFFKDRQKRIIKISGINVFPQEIENVVNTIDDIIASCAVEKIIKNKKVIWLYVETKNNCELTDNIKENIMEAISTNLMKYCMPSKIIKIDKMIYNQIGKVDYKKIQNLNINA